MALLNFDFSNTDSPLNTDPIESVVITESIVDLESDNFDTEAFLIKMKEEKIRWDEINPNMSTSIIEVESKLAATSLSSTINSKVAYDVTLINLKAEWKQLVYDKKILILEIDSKIKQVKDKLNYHMNSK